MKEKMMKFSSVIVQRSDCNRKDFENYSKLKGVTKKDVEDLVEIRLNQINDAKLKTIADLKKEYEDKISGEKEYFENDKIKVNICYPGSKKIYPTPLDKLFKNIKSTPFVSEEAWKTKIFFGKANIGAEYKSKN